MDAIEISRGGRAVGGPVGFQLRAKIFFSGAFFIIALEALLRTALKFIEGLFVSRVTVGKIFAGLITKIPAAFRLEISAGWPVTEVSAAFTTTFAPKAAVTLRTGIAVAEIAALRSVGKVLTGIITTACTPTKCTFFIRLVARVATGWSIAKIPAAFGFKVPAAFAAGLTARRARITVAGLPAGFVAKILAGFGFKIPAAFAAKFTFLIGIATGGTIPIPGPVAARGTGVTVERAGSIPFISFTKAAPGGTASGLAPAAATASLAAPELLSPAARFGLEISLFL
jgi:hypothetical protein